MLVAMRTQSNFGRALGVLAGGVLLVGVAGCSSGGTAVTPSASATEFTGGSQSLGWQFVRSSDAAVEIEVTHGACDNGPRATLTETPTSVSIAVQTQTRTGACAAVGIVTPVSVKLTTPLGKRLLLGCGKLTADCRT